MKRLLKLSGISYSAELKNSLFGSAARKDILKDINFDVLEREFLAVSGSSGGGKTTLAKIIAGIITPSTGEIIYANIKPEEIQLLFQNNVELINPNRKVIDILNESVSLAEISKLPIRIEKDEVFKILEIPESLFEKRGFELSGGQRQKVGLARILFQNPKLLILDEPFAAQDFDTVEKIRLMLHELIANFDISIICISHLLRHFNGFEGRIVLIENGEIKSTEDLNTTV